MTYRDIYEDLSSILAELYDPREGATIARYLIEDIFQANFWSEESATELHISELGVIKERLATYEPWQYIGGWADFYGYKFQVDKNVLIPRPETEELVMIALETIKERNLNSILDIGTGSGIIPITIKKKFKNVGCFGLDKSERALDIAHKNNEYHTVKVDWLTYDFLNEKAWSDLPKVDMVISNPPYITEGEKSEMHSNVLEHEPHMALFVNDNAMEFYSALAHFVVKCQSKGCVLLVEINEHRGQEVVDTFSKNGLTDIELIKDMQGKDRMVMAIV